MATPVLGHSEKSPSEYKSPLKRASNIMTSKRIFAQVSIAVLHLGWLVSVPIGLRLAPPPPPPQSTQLEQLEDQSAEHIAAHSTFDTILLSVLGVWGFHALSSPSVGHKNSYRHTSPWPLTIVSTAIRSYMQLEEAPLCLGRSISTSRTRGYYNYCRTQMKTQ